MPILGTDRDRFESPVPLVELESMDGSRIDIPSAPDMTTYDYMQFVPAPVFLGYALYCFFSVHFIGRPPLWTSLGGGLVMSHLSRWTVGVVCAAFGVWQVFRGLFQLQLSNAGAVVLAIALGAMLFCLWRDRRNRVARAAS